MYSEDEINSYMEKGSFENSDYQEFFDSIGNQLDKPFEVAQSNVRKNGPLNSGRIYTVGTPKYTVQANIWLGSIDEVFYRLKLNATNNTFSEGSVNITTANDPDQAKEVARIVAEEIKDNKHTGV